MVVLTKCASRETKGTLVQDSRANRREVGISVRDNHAKVRDKCAVVCELGLVVSRFAAFCLKPRAFLRTDESSVAANHAKRHPFAGILGTKRAFVRAKPRFRGPKHAGRAVLLASLATERAALREECASRVDSSNVRREKCASHANIVQAGPAEHASC